MRRLVLGVAPRQADFERRGFHLGSAEVRAAAEAAVRHAFTGHGIALQLGDPARVGAQLERLDPFARPYAYEGAAIGLTTLDALRPGFGDRHRRLVAGPGRRYVVPVLAGVGMALGAIGRDHRRCVAALDPFTRWMVPDGIGFFCGYTRPRRTIHERRRPRRIEGPERACFDAGVGRALWFLECGEPQRIADTIAGFEPPRRGALWSGVGVAATFLGGADQTRAAALRAAAGGHAPALVRGVGLAVSIFDRAGTMPAHVEPVCRALCDHPAAWVAEQARRARREVGDIVEPGAWEAWRQRTQQLVVGS